MVNGDELSRRPAGDVGKLVMDLLALCDPTVLDEPARQTIGKAADALTALPSVGELSSAPPSAIEVDAGVEELAKQQDDMAHRWRLAGNEIFSAECKATAIRLRTLSRTNRQQSAAWENARKDVEAEFMRASGHRRVGLSDAMTILARHAQPSETVGEDAPAIRAGWPTPGRQEMCILCPFRAHLADDGSA